MQKVRSVGSSCKPKLSAFGHALKLFLGMTIFTTAISPLGATRVCELGGSIKQWAVQIIASLIINAFAVKAYIDIFEK